MEPYSTALDFAAKQVRRVIETAPGFYPMYTEGGRWRHGRESWTHWCEGFFPGMMWLLWEQTKDNYWREQAERYSKPLEPRQHDRDVHDLGFIFLSTYLPWYRASGDPALQKVLITAGQTLAMRFQERGKYLRSFLASESLFIDIMMNVGIIFHAAGLLKDEKLWTIARQHCLTTRRYLVRGDGSTSHEGIFDAHTGEFVKQTTQQGYRNDSCWTRGLAWALYGFGTAYHYSRETVFLDTARHCAACYLEHSPASDAPPWDYDVPEGPERFPDTSAGAIAAAGLFNLAKVSGDPQYRQAALTLTATLATKYVASRKEGWEGVLLEGVYHKHKNLGVRESVIWGDYFFTQALVAALEEGA